MRILYVTTIGSTINFFSSFIADLIDAGHSVDLASGAKGGQISEEFNNMKCIQYNLSCSRNPLGIGNLKSIREIKKIVLNGHYNIVHCHTPIAAACCRVACRGLRKRGVRVFYTAHGFHFYKGASLKNWLVYYPIEWLCSWWTDVLITINREDYGRANKHFHAKETVYVPGVGIDLSKFSGLKDGKNEVRKLLGIPNDAFVLASAGELNPNKNHEVVIRALAEIKNRKIHYIIAGSGGLRENLEKICESLHITEQVHFLGWRQDIPDIYRCADVCVFPSIREGLGLAAIEGMASGLPLIVSDNRGSRDYTENGVNACVVACHDIYGFREAINRLYEDKVLCIRMGKLNQKRCKRFTVENVNRMMADIYKAGTT